MSRFRVRLLSALLCIAGCSAVERPLPQNHPADSNAPEEPYQPPRNPFGGELSPTEDRGEAGYSCPMHPEVQSSKPGECPKCGMKLEPRKKK